MCAHSLLLHLPLSRMVLGIVEQLVATVAVSLVGMAFPAYMSFKVLQAKGGARDARPLLAYWCCFAIFVQLTTVFEALYLHQFVPLYYLAKVGALCYLVAPQVSAQCPLHMRRPPRASR